MILCLALGDSSVYPSKLQSTKNRVQSPTKSRQFKAMTSRSCTQNKAYLRQNTESSEQVADIGARGAGNVYLPCFSSPPRLRRYKSPSNSLISFGSSSLLSSADRRKPTLLTSVVHEREVADIVNRLSRPTISTKRKTVKLYPNLGYVDMNFYSWRNMQLYKDYQRTIFNDKGAVKPSFRRCGARNSGM
ncbi:uncharacterized protein [Haliotis asinina]|uniref:uncharacterized protein n=1 Tax=Haliotis asinina TaxID=109174 RepID=UPI0035325FF4